MIYENLVVNDVFAFPFSNTQFRGLDYINVMTNHTIEVKTYVSHDAQNSSSITFGDTINNVASIRAEIPHLYLYLDQKLNSISYMC